MSAGSAAVVAKARAKYGKLLGLDEYKTLISKANVGEIVTQLKNYDDFDKDFSGVDSSVRRGQAERLLRNRMFRVYDELRKFCPGTKNRFNDFLLLQEEVNQIINAAMYIGAGVYQLFIPGFPGYLTDICSYDILSLSKARTYGEILSVLENTPYYDVLAPVAEGTKDFPPIITIDHELTKYLYSTLLDYIKKDMSGSDREEAEKCIKRRCDMYNIKICYRLKGLFKMDTQEVLRYTLPIYSRFDRNLMEQVLSIADNERILPQLLKLPYFKDVADIEGIDIETAVYTSNKRYYEGRLALSQSASVVMYSLAELMMIENRNLTTVIEGVRYSLEPSEIEKMLIL